MRFRLAPALAGILIATSILPAVVGLHNVDDCDVTNYALTGGPKYRAISFRYDSAGEPIQVEGLVSQSISAAADTWTSQRNSCNVPDTTSAQYALGTVVQNSSPRIGNGLSEIYWVACEGCGVSYAYPWTGTECDIVLNPTAWDLNPVTDAIGSYADQLPTILAREMGWCLGLADPGQGPLNTMNGGYCTDALGVSTLLQHCGLTLSQGDMLGLRRLWPS